MCKVLDYYWFQMTFAQKIGSENKLIHLIQREQSDEIWFTELPERQGKHTF